MVSVLNAWVECWVVMPNLEKDKVWIILFTCLTIRSVTLEVVLSMTTEEFLLALRRFCSLRGTPKKGLRGECWTTDWT